MTPFEIMIQEHRIIEIVLDCLSEMIQDVMTQRKLKFFDAENAINFFKNYADKFHHCKEEDQLFKIVEEKNIPEELEYIRDLLSDHEKGRTYVKGMADSFREAAHGNSDMLMEFAKNGRDYIDILRAHILKEDRMFFPLVEKSFSDDEKKKLTRSFGEVKTSDIDSLTGKKYTDIAMDLALIYNVKFEGMNEIM